MIDHGDYDEEDLVEIDPVNSYTKESGQKKNVYSYRYSFGEFHIDELKSREDCEDSDLPKKVDDGGGSVDIHLYKDYVVWEFKDNIPVFVFRDKIMSPKDSKSTRKTAYFALHFFENRGLISGWRKL